VIRSGSRTPRLAITAAVAALAVLAVPAPAQPAGDALRIIAFGAHPDDAELKAAGVAAKWAAQGHKVKFVSMTNGDIGHFSQAGGPLALRRRAEVEACARRLGIETEVLDIHDGELMPTLENRREVVRLIREWGADVVLFHRTNDYHPDHRYTGVLVQDAAVLVAAPFFMPYTPALKRNPVLLHYSDGFQKPIPFEPTLVVGIDDVADRKWECLASIPSQFADADSWQARYQQGVPTEPAAREAHIAGGLKQRNADVADRYRNLLVELYGASGRSLRYAEAFELSEYGRQPSGAELRQLFPFFGGRGSGVAQ
jgi:LmbE family N-acetylglucosaminyl deacetylase